MNVETTELPGVLLIEPTVFSDDRGSLFESFSAERYAGAGMPGPFVQDNHTHSVAGTVRGLHYQLDHPQAKLIRVVRGRVFDVAVDIRRSSATFGQWMAVELTASNRRQLYIPEGFAHGFCALEESEVLYKCAGYYAPDDDRGVLWRDPSLAIPWPVADPIVSAKDETYLPLTLDRSDLPA